MTDVVEEMVALLSEPSGTEPVYARIRDHFARLVRQGRLKPGERLPPVRQLAERLSINPMTVARAYRQLSDAGLVQGRGGAGSFVSGTAAPASAPAPPNGPSRSDAIIDEVGGGAGTLSARLFELAQAPGVISFTTNYPEPAHSEVPALKRCIAELAASPAADGFFRYDPPAGREELREVLVGFAAAHGIAATTRNIVITSGGQQAIDIAARTVVAPGDRVIVERPSYFGLLNVLRNARAELIEIEAGDGGPDIDRLEDLIRRHKPAMLCLNPTFQNPTGASIELERRKAILALARRNAVVVVEDDPYPEMRFRGEELPSLAALATGEEVFYCRGFGKMFLPGVRLGFAIVPERWLSRYLAIKASTDLQSNAFMQGAVAMWIGEGAWRDAAASIAAFYGQRQRLLVERLQPVLPPDVEFLVPDGGLNLWLQLPVRASTSDLYFRAARNGVAFAASDSFHAQRSHSRGPRISFGKVEGVDLDLGVERLQAVLRDLCSAPRADGSWFV